MNPQSHAPSTAQAQMIDLAAMQHLRSAESDLAKDSATVRLMRDIAAYANRERALSGQLSSAADALMSADRERDQLAGMLQANAMIAQQAVFPDWLKEVATGPRMPADFPEYFGASSFQEIHDAALAVSAINDSSIARIAAAMNEASGRASLLEARRSLESLSQLSLATESITTRITALSAHFETLPEWMRMAPSVEMYLSVRSLSLIAYPELEEDALYDEGLDERAIETNAAFDSRLASVSYGLLRPVRGAWQVARSDLDDNIAQAAFSMRRAVTLLIRRLAPNRDVGQWVRAQAVFQSPDATRSLMNTKIPTWEARLRYIMRKPDAAVGGSFVGEFTETDLSDFLHLLKTFNVAVHEEESEIDQEALEALLHRAMGFMTLLLDAAEM